MQIPHQAISVKAIPCIREQCFMLLITWSPAWQGAGQVQISPRNQTEPRLWRQWSTNQLPTGKLPLDIQSACLLSRIFCRFYYKEKKIGHSPSLGQNGDEIPTPHCPLFCLTDAYCPSPFAPFLSVRVQVLCGGNLFPTRMTPWLWSKESEVPGYSWQTVSAATWGQEGTWCLTAKLKPIKILSQPSCC